MKRWLVVIAACITVVAVLGFIKYSQVQAAIEFGSSFPEPSETVEAVSAVATQWQPQVKASAEIVPTRAIEIINELPGTITRVGFKSGDTLQAGQLLIQLDTSEEEAQLSAAKARAELAGRLLARNKKLASSQAVSEQANDAALADRDAAVAEARRVQAIIDKKTLRAPFNAHAGLHRWEVGGYLAAGTSVTTLVGIEKSVWIDFSLPQLAEPVAIGATVRLQMAGRDAEATVIARDSLLTPGSRSVRYRALAEDAALAAMPGALLNVIAAQGDPIPAISVPAVGVRQDAFGTHVFVLARAENGADADFRAERRSVEVLTIAKTTAYLSAGLQADERVAAAGAFKLRDGLLANVANSDQVDEVSTP